MPSFARLSLPHLNRYQRLFALEKEAKKKSRYAKA
jgi:hypothetical protein